MWREGAGFGLVLAILAGLSGCIETSLERVKDPPVEGDRVLAADPLSVDFGVLPPGASVTDVVAVTAIGELPVTLASIEVSGSTAYTVTQPAAGTVLEPGHTLDLVVTYTPASFDDQADLVVRSDAVEPTLVVPLLGAGHYPALSIAPASVHFLSEYGETVDAEVVVTSVGTADLLISDLYVEGAWFSAAGSIPVTLPPGDSTTLSVRYTPEVEGETAAGKLWLTTNTPAGFAVVPLEASYGVPCIGLGEAWDRGLLHAQTLIDGHTLEVSNLSADVDLCIDRWYVWLAEESQDLGAGDMSGDYGGDYPFGSLEIPRSGSLRFDAGAREDASWWCMERTQTTDRSRPYEFLGAYVPEPLHTSMRATDQDGVWDWMDDNPVMIAARGTNYLEVSPAGGSGSVTLRVLNMGSEPGEAELRESVPAGWSASDFSIAPDRTEAGREGATVYVWDVALEAREETGQYEHTVYDERYVTYTLTVPACLGRQYADELTTTWLDTDGAMRTASANPLVVNCAE